MLPPPDHRAGQRREGPSRRCLWLGSPARLFIVRVEAVRAAAVRLMPIRVRSRGGHVLWLSAGAPTLLGSLAGDTQPGGDVRPGVAADAPPHPRRAGCARR